MDPLFLNFVIQIKCIKYKTPNKATIHHLWEYFGMIQKLRWLLRTLDCERTCTPVIFYLGLTNLEKKSPPPQYQNKEKKSKKDPILKITKQNKIKK